MNKSRRDVVYKSLHLARERTARSPIGNCPHDNGKALQLCFAEKGRDTIEIPEREILHLIARGESNTAIAKRLALSLKTVQNHVSNIFSKLQVADRAQAIVRAHDGGLK